MKIRTILFAMLALASTRAAAQAPCATAPVAGATVFFIQAGPVAARDTVAVARLCLTTGTKLGSFMATLSYDSTRMVVRQVQSRGGMQAANSRVPGTVRIAGASPAGFTSGELAVITFRLLGERTLSRIALTIGEANTTTGASVLGSVRWTGWPVSPPPSRRPTIDSISPRTAPVSHERVTDLVLYGKGFAAVDNTVVFGGAEVTGLASERNGTIIRFAAPSEIPARGSVPPHRVQPGRIEIRVRHAGGTSNSIAFIVAGERDGE